MGQRSVVGISASKVVALIGSLILIADSIILISTLEWYNIFFGILGIIGALVIIISLRIIELRQVYIPYEWWILLLVGGLLLIMFALGSGGSALLRGSIIIVIAGVLEILSEKRDYTTSEIVAWIGAILTIVFSILSGDILRIFIGIICAFILILALLDQLKEIPFTWWVVLILGFVIFTWADIIGGTIVLIAFVLILMSY